jgi:hypothetical protein
VASFYRVLGLLCAQICGLFASVPVFFISSFTLLSCVDQFPARWFHWIGFLLLIFFGSRQSAPLVSSAPRSGFLPRCALVMEFLLPRSKGAVQFLSGASLPALRLVFSSLGFQLARFSTGQFAAVSSPAVASPFHFACAHKDSAPPASVISSSSCSASKLCLFLVPSSRFDFAALQLRLGFLQVHFRSCY